MCTDGNFAMPDIYLRINKDEDRHADFDISLAALITDLIDLKQELAEICIVLGANCWLRMGP